MTAKRIIILLTSLLWVAVAAAVIASKQHTLRTGARALLETEPVDPRDFLRGDYVILGYKIGSLDINKLITEKPEYKEGETVYVKLLPDEDKFWKAAVISSAKDLYGPGDIFIKGRVRSFYSNKLSVDYGIESYFVPEGKGGVIEKNMRRDSANVVSVEACIDRSGGAVINRIFINGKEIVF